MTKIFLKELEKHHFNDEYVSWHKSDHTVFYTTSRREFSKEDLLDEYLRGKEQNNIYHYGIFYKENSKLIGVLKLGVINWHDRTSDMIVFIGDKDFLGQGLAVEAIKQGNEIAFNKHKLRKLFGGMFKDNVGSVKAYLNANWVIEGVLRNQYVHKEIEQDRILVACFNPSLYNEEYHLEGLHKFEEIYPSKQLKL